MCVFYVLERCILFSMVISSASQAQPSAAIGGFPIEVPQIIQVIGPSLILDDLGYLYRNIQVI